MNIRYLMASSAAALLLTVSPCLAGVCTKDIADTEAAFDAKLGAAAAAGPTAPELTSATMHRQPTPDTVARAEAQLGDISRENADVVTLALERARDADEIGDVNACQQQLAEAKQALGK